MAKVLTPETQDDIISNSYTRAVFLAGTIEMGNSVDWQSEMIEHLAHLDAVIYNPRRVIAPTEVAEIDRQINWELDRIYAADFIFMYLAPNSISPISLLELGICLHFKKPLIVVCDPAYTRKQNVQVTMGRFDANPNQHLVYSLGEGISLLEGYMNGN